MKSIKVETKSRSKYPYLGINGVGIIVLFTSPEKGVQLYYNEIKLGQDIEIGEYKDNIMESKFKPFDGEIILSNS